MGKIAEPTWFRLPLPTFAIAPVQSRLSCALSFPDYQVLAFAERLAELYVRNPRWLLSTKRRNAMDWNRVEGNWKQAKGKVKEQWGKLTDDDLDVIAGQRDQLEGKIQERYGKAKDEAKKDVDAWYNSQTWQ